MSLWQEISDISGRERSPELRQDLLCPCRRQCCERCRKRTNSHSPRSPHCRNISEQPRVWRRQRNQSTKACRKSGIYSLTCGGSCWSAVVRQTQHTVAVVADHL